MAIRAFLLCIILFSSSYTSFALYEDQVGLMDWHQQYIGKVKKAVFQTQKAGRKRVVVSTEENAIAALDLRHGEIFWRQILGVNDVIDEIDIALGKYVVTLSSGGSVLRAWNLPDGQMVWESFLLGSKPSRSLLLTPTNFGADKDNVILAYGNGCLHAVSSIDGDILWKKELAENSIDVQHLVHPEESDTIYALGIGEASQFEAYVINVRNGELLKHSSKGFTGGFSGDLSLPTSDKVVVLDSSKSSLVSISFVGGEIKFQEFQISDLQGYSGEAVLLPSKLAGMVAIKIDRSLLFVKLKDEGTLEVVDTVPHVEAVSDSLSFAEGQTAFALIQQDGAKIQLTIKSSNDWKSHFLKESIEFDQQRGLVHKVFINNYVRTDRTYGFRALIVMEDHSLLLLQQGAVVWNREDALASIIDVTTSELPVQKDGVSVAKVEHNLFEWLKGHLLKLKATLMLATPDDVAAVQRIRLQSAEKSKMTRDHNGFRKLLIVLTRAGKLFALHTGDGRIVWSRLLNAFHKSGTCESPRGIKLHQWQVPHHHALDENPSVLVVGTCGHNSDASGILSFVDAYKGEELNYLAPVHSITQIIPLPFTDSTEQRLHLIIDSEGYGHLYPRTPEAVDIFQKELGNIYWYSVDINNNLLKGHVVKKNCKEEIADDYCFESSDLWSVIFPSDSEKIIATSTRKFSEVVHTQAKVNADQDVLYKYISKNLLFLATVTPKAMGDIGSVIPDDSWLFVYLVDTITGRVLLRMSHHGCQGPVHAVFSENWVVYHYFNLRAHRYEMSVVEIYDQSRADNKDVLKLVLGKHNLSAPVSSYSRPEIMTKSQSYFFTHSVKAVSVTSTAKGITSKQLLIGTIGDQVLALDKRFLDPRRSLNPTQAEKEEGIMPLTDTLPIMPQAFVTHALKVEGLRSIIAIPAKLESTTLIFAHGVDLFFTRLAPSKTYDSLTDDFNYALLLLTIVALVISIFVTWIWSERIDLQEKWR